MGITPFPFPAIICILLSALAHALPQFDFNGPVPTTTPNTGAFRNVTFDDIVIVDPLLNFQHMVPGYMGLYWENMTAILVGGNVNTPAPYTGPVAGVPAHSGSQAAAFGPQLFSKTYGIPLPQVPTTASGAVSVNWLGSSAKEFDLQEFWFGCYTSSLQSIISTPQACTLDLSGWRRGTPTSGAPSAQASFVYYAYNLVKAPMMFADLNWRGMQRVELKRRAIGLTDEAIEGVLLDDVAVVVR